MQAMSTSCKPSPACLLSMYGAGEQQAPSAAQEGTGNRKASCGDAQTHRQSHGHPWGQQHSHLLGWCPGRVQPGASKAFALHAAPTVQSGHGVQGRERKLISAAAVAPVARLISR